MNEMTALPKLQDEAKKIYKDMDSLAGIMNAINRRIDVLQLRDRTEAEHGELIDLNEQANVLQERIDALERKLDGIGRKALVIIHEQETK